MTGKLATLDKFIESTKSLLKKKGDKATEVVTETTDDPEQEMKTFWFSNEHESQEEKSWLPGLVCWSLIDLINAGVHLGIF